MEENIHVIEALEKMLLNKDIDTKTLDIESLRIVIDKIEEKYSK